MILIFRCQTQDFNILEDTNQQQDLLIHAAVKGGIFPISIQYTYNLHTEILGVEFGIWTVGKIHALHMLLLMVHSVGKFNVKH